MTSNILIIDDNPLNNDVLAVMLKKAGIDYVTLNLPIHLRETLDQIDHLDAILLDLEMPGMNGFEALEILKDHPLSQSIPIVAYSVHVSQANAVRDAGFHSFLAKPVDSHRFTTHLQRILSGEHVWEI